VSRTIAERSNSADEFFRRLGESWFNNLRVSIPGIIQSFDAVTQTATVQVAIREKIRGNDLLEQWVNIPLLLDVPIVLPRAGNFVLTMPVKKGDECLIVFSDMCIDAWFSNSGVQNQIEKRRHDLSDAFAVIGCWSQPNKISNYSTNSTQLRTKDGNSYIEVKDDQINIVANSVTINGREVGTV